MQKIYKGYKLVFISLAATDNYTAYLPNGELFKSYSPNGAWTTVNLTLVELQSLPSWN